MSPIAVSIAVALPVPVSVLSMITALIVVFSTVMTLVIILDLGGTGCRGGEACRRLDQAGVGQIPTREDADEYARAVRELVDAKVEQRAPEVEIETTKGETPKVINIMDALKKSMEAKGQTKVTEAVRKMGKSALTGCTCFDASDKTVIAPHNALAFTATDELPTHFDAETRRILLIMRFNHKPS